MVRYLGSSNVWECSESVLHDFDKRAKGKFTLSCCQQIAVLLKQYINKGDRLLDAGCGTAHFYHSLKDMNIPVEYYGIDISELLLANAKKNVSKFGLNPAHLKVQNILDIDVSYDFTVCINTLCFMPHYHAYLDRLLRATDKILILRMSLSDKEEISYLVDGCLDSPYEDLKLNFNTYDLEDVKRFIADSGFEVEQIRDEYTRDGEEIVAGDKKLYRKILLCRRKNSFN
jgi:ubiquinone/menaquinone biosynthesis C-methylase UbiE